MRLLLISRAAVGLTLLSGSGASLASAQETSPVVVELFTSQGCAACPPANDYFAEVTQRPGIVALSFHVDYWNYLGWVDPYSSKKATYRQKMYAMNLRQTGVFTPQVVIQGRRGEVGSDRRAIESAIDEARKAKRSVRVTFEKGGAQPSVAVTAAPEAKGAEVWLLLIDRQTSTKVLRGENEGRTLTHRNVVRDWQQIGQHGGERLELPLTATCEKGEKHGRMAVIVQQPKGGAILGAAITDLENK